MRWLWVGLGLLHLAIWSAVALRPGLLRGDAPELDPLRCYARPSVTYWDGERGYRVAVPSDFRSQVVCWPRDGCMVDDASGDARCWRVGRLERR